MLATVVGAAEVGAAVAGAAVVGIAKLIEVIKARLSAHIRFDDTTSKTVITLRRPGKWYRHPPN